MAAWLAMAVFLFLTLRSMGNLTPELIWVLVALLAALIWVEIAWASVREEYGSPAVSTDLVAAEATRNLITRGLGEALIIFAGLFGLSLIDTLGRSLWQVYQERSMAYIFLVVRRIDGLPANSANGGQLADRPCTGRWLDWFSDNIHPQESRPDVHCFGARVGPSIARVIPRTGCI